MLLSSFKDTPSNIQTKQKNKTKTEYYFDYCLISVKTVSTSKASLYFNHHRKGQLLNYMINFPLNYQYPDNPFSLWVPMLQYSKWKQVIRLNIRRSKVCQCEMQHKSLCVQHIVMKMNQEDDNKKMVNNKTHNALHG